MRKFITGLIAAAGFVAFSAEANAQMLCKKRTEVLTQLSSTYKEAPVAMGLASNGAVLEVLSSEQDGRTWTILLTRPNGISCVMATGEGWQDVERAVLSSDPVS